MPAVELQGQCDARFKRVREIFEASFASGAELGAGLCVYLDGRLVIDTERALMVHRRGRPLCYVFAADEVGDLPSEPEPAAPEIGRAHV